MIDDVEASKEATPEGEAKDMWQKDGNGEWFVAGVIDIPAGNAKMLRWSKDDDGTWFQTSTLAVLSPGIRLGLAG